MRRLAAAFIICIASHAAAQKIVPATPLTPVTVSELASFDPAVEQPRREIRHRRLAPLDLWLAAPLPHTDLVPAATPAIAPPRMTAAFSANSSSFLAPSDASGAVGREYVVTANNAGLVVQDRAGVQLKIVSLFTFLGESVVGSGDYYDPRAAYDPVADRWIVIGINERSSGISMIVAVSQTGDPRGAWNRYRLTIGDVPIIDFSRLALTRDTVMIGTQGHYELLCYIVSIRKTDLYGTSTALPTTQYHFDLYDVAPVQNDDSAIEYVVHNNYSGKLQVKRLTEPDSAWRKIDAIVPWGQYTEYAPQAGTSRTLDTGWLYPVEQAVYRNGAIYAVHTGILGGGIGILWWKIDPETGARLDAGTIEDPARQKYYAYPSLAVNRSGAMVIGFCVFSPTTFPSAGYAYRDTLGRVSTAGEVKAGEGSFEWSERWGDYTTTVTDPLDDRAFWTIQIISQNNRWQTWWGKIELEPARRRSARH